MNSAGAAKPTLTVFTPTYNRAYILHQCYESLRRQTCRDFLWLIIDDGSSDGTDKLVSSWQQAGNDFEIKYVCQENQGMHGAHNTACAVMDTELNVCIDSDDYMPDDAVEKIVSFWRGCGRDDGVAGFIALDAYQNGEIIGGRLPEGIKRARYYDFFNTYGARHDKKLVYRSELTRLYPYPLFEGERFVDLATKYSLLDSDYQLLSLDEVLCIVEYLPDGSSLNILRQYAANPRGFAYSRKVFMQLPFASLKYKFRQAVHYVSSSLMIKNSRYLKESPSKILTVLASPPGFLLSIYIKSMVEQGRPLPSTLGGRLGSVFQLIFRRKT